MKMDMTSIFCVNCEMTKDKNCKLQRQSTIKCSANHNNMKVNQRKLTSRKEVMTSWSTWLLLFLCLASCQVIYGQKTVSFKLKEQLPSGTFVGDICDVSDTFYCFFNTI